MPDTGTGGRIARALELRDRSAFRTLCEGVHPSDLAEWLSGTEDDAVLRALDWLPAEAAADVFSRLDLARQAGLAARAGAELPARLLAGMDADDRTDLIQAVSEPERARLLALLDAEDRAETERLAAYPEGSVGAEMSTEFAAVPQGLTIREALGQIRAQMPSREGVYYVYATDERGRLAGFLSLRDLVMVPLNRRVSEAMHRDVVSVRADDDLRLAVEKVKEYDLAVLPVVQAGGRLVGMITIDDVLDVEQQVATEDFHKLGSVISVAQPLGAAPIRILYRARIPWLLALVGVNIFSGAGIAYFEETIQAMVVLVFFLPLLIDSGGNAGAQSATLVVRALATGDIRPGDWRRLLLRELALAAALGLAMTVPAAALGAWRGGAVVAAVVGLTMFCVVLAGSLMGLCLPFLLTRLKLDPATASSPLVTSLTDIAGVLIFFGIARRLTGL